jgi:N-acetylglutamate synthase
VEFAGGGRSAIRVTPADVGKRVSVRQTTGSAAPGAKFTDTVGLLTSWDDDVLLITRRGGEAVRVPWASVVAAKVVPDAPARRTGPAASDEELVRACARAWQPVESEPLGGWLLRAAGGFTRRANSVLPLGDPGVPLDEALRRVRSWYGQRGLPPYVQGEAASPRERDALHAALAERGWGPVVAADVWTGALARVGDLDADTSRVVLHRDCDEPWLRGYRHAADGTGAHALHVLRSGPSTWFATVPDPAGDAREGLPAAIGRCVVDGRWAGFMAIEVAEAHRRRGLARALMAALARRALEEGASAAWLQVEEGNTPARTLYTDMGFSSHHTYQYFLPS